MSTVPIPPILSLLIGHIAAAVPRRARITFTELLIGAAATRGGHVTDAILAEAALGGWAVAQLDHGLLVAAARPLGMARRLAGPAEGAQDAVRPAGRARGPR